MPLVPTNGTLTICSGTISVPATAIASGAKAQYTATCTGAATTDNVMVGFGGGVDWSTLTGFLPSTSGILTAGGQIITAGTLTVTIENNTGSSITPTAFTLNFRVTR